MRVCELLEFFALQSIFLFFSKSLNVSFIYKIFYVFYFYYIHTIMIYKNQMPIDTLSVQKFD